MGVDEQAVVEYLYMEPSPIIVNVQASVARLVLNRPEKRNALDDTVIAAVTEAFDRLNTDPAVRVIVVSGHGPAFCAGGDLEWMKRGAERSYDENIADCRRLRDMFVAIARSPKATIAQMHGAAMGGGAGLVAVCDIAIATTDATFAFSEVRLGLAPAVIAPFVVRRIGPAAARSLFVTGQRFGVVEALRTGLIHRVAEADALPGAVNDIVGDLLQCGPQAIAAIKQLLNDIDGVTIDEAGEQSAQCLAKLRTSDEGREGINAFLDKRKPNFTA